MPTIPFKIVTEPSNQDANELGTAEYIGDGVFLTAAHLLQYYRDGVLLSTDAGYVVGPAGDINFGEPDFHVYPQYDVSITQGTISRSANYYDIAYVRTSGGNISASASNPIIAFADGDAATSFLTR